MFIFHGGWWTAEIWGEAPDIWSCTVRQLRGERPVIISHPHFKVNDKQQNHHWLFSSKDLFICPKILGIRRLQVSCVCPKDTTNCRSYSCFGDHHLVNQWDLWKVGSEQRRRQQLFCLKRIEREEIPLSPWVIISRPTQIIDSYK